MDSRPTPWSVRRGRCSQNNMRVTIASDHAGYELKQLLIEYLRQQGHEINDAGTHSTAPVDYPEYSEAVASSLRLGDAERGILSFGSGGSRSVASEKLPRIR